MDPHAPYLPPAPYERMFYHGNETDPANKTMEPVMAFKPFRDFFASWMPPGISDKDYVIAQYDGAIAYMDACIQSIFTALEAHGIHDETHRRAQRRSWRNAVRSRVLVRPSRHLRQHPARSADHPLSGQNARRQARVRASRSTKTWSLPCWNWRVSKRAFRSTAKACCP